MATVGNIIFFGVLAFILFFIIKRLWDNHILKQFFDEKNCYIFGPKGSGKDLCNQHRVKMLHGKKYLSNVNYGGNYIHIDIKDLTVAPNTFEQLIDGKVTIIEKHPEWEGADCYISDAGIYLPSQYDTLLSKKYPSLPIFYALSRQLYNMKMHINSQAFGRVWVKMREQADGFIKCKKTFKIGPWLFSRRILYDRLKSAEDDVRPMHKVGLFNKYNRAEIEDYHAKYGLVTELLNVQTTKNIKFDSRYFHSLFFGFVWVDKQTKFGKFMSKVKAKLTRKRAKVKKSKDKTER